MNKAKRKVIFVTTVFEGVNTGPGTFAQYLWEAFRDDPDIEFHLVAQRISQTHPRLHQSDPSSSSLELYKNVQLKALEVMGDDLGGFIVHGNTPHNMEEFTKRPVTLFIQANDYMAAEIWEGILEKMKRVGLRRILGLIWRRGKERKTFQRAKLIIPNSNFTKNRLINAYNIPADHFQTIYKAVDSSQFVRPDPDNIPPDPLPQRPKGYRLAFVGSDWQTKGLDLLLDAFRIVEKANSELSLAVVGSLDLPANVQMKEQVDRDGLLGKIHFVGKKTRAEVPTYLWHSDIYILPSRQEALGVSVLEAMAAGLPVVAARVGGIPEIIRNDDEGVLFDGHDPQELADHLVTLLGSEELRNKLTANGAPRVKSFDKTIMIRKVKDAYMSLDI